VKRGDVYLAKLDPSSGSEQSGSRPVVIVSRDAINRSSPVVIAVPCTSWTEGRRIYPSQVQINEFEGGLKRISIALCEQVRAISKDRLGRRWGALSHPTLAKVDRALLIALDLPGQFGSS
jgi:mRNA interferase MazF